jgi:cytochrome c oxidase subunit 2
MWEVRYDDGRRDLDEMHVELNKPVVLLLSSEDVIHNFFVPAFRLKQDVVPGKVVRAWFEPTRPGSYLLLCSQYCGSAHSQMVGRVVVLGPEDYAAWARGEPNARESAQGRALFVRYGCAGCHDAQSVRSPPLTGLYQTVVRLSDGSFTRADSAFIHDVISGAEGRAVSGYPAVMPHYHGVIPETGIAELVAYVKSLPPAAEPLPDATHR